MNFYTLVLISVLQEFFNVSVIIIQNPLKLQIFEMDLTIGSRSRLALAFGAALALAFDLAFPLAFALAFHGAMSQGTVKAMWYWT